MTPLPKTDLQARLSRLSPEHRGVVLGVGLLGEGPLIVDHLVGAPPDCVKAIEALSAVTRDERAAALADLSRGLAGPGPLSRLSSATADRLIDALAAEPLALARAVLVGLPPPLRVQVLTELAARAGCPPDALPAPALLSPALLAEVQTFVLARLGQDP